MSRYDTDLISKGYSFLPDVGVWAREDATSFGYSDGDETEENLLRTLQEADDVSLFSQELRTASKDWPTTYHLSPARGNLLRPIARLLRGSVLEIGAGCGAITRFLGENGANVLALEGSQRRAAIAAQRTRDLVNVTVINDKFEEFDTEALFDAVTLIGVLEYAGEFNRSEDAPLQMLKTARRLLKPGGVLIIAIENQLGLKYLAGAPEDHIGSPFVGVHDLYNRPGVRTYGRLALEQLLKSAGLEDVEFALPFPDYKLPTSVILPAGYDRTNGFEGGILAAQVSSRDLQLSSLNLSFSLERAWGTVGENSLLPELANSFLVLGRSYPDGAVPLFEENVLAYHFSTSRRPGFCKTAKFLLDDVHGIGVTNEFIYPDAEQAANSSQYAHRLPQDAYHSGSLFSEKFIRVFQTPGWTAKEVADLLREYLDIVVMHAGSGEMTTGKLRLEQSISGQFLDLIPQNIILRDNAIHVIDQEWECKNKISLAYLSFRALTTCIRMISSFSIPADLRWLSIGRLFEDIFSHLDFDLLEEHYLDFAMQEAAFMTFASDADPRPIAYRDWHSQIIPSYIDRLSDRSFVDHINALSDLSETYLRQIKWLESENSSLHEQLENNLSVFKDANDTHLNQIRRLESENSSLHEQLTSMERKIQEDEAARQQNSLLERLKSLF